jgi:transposase
MISVDLSKHVFQVCGVNDRLKPLFNKKLSRDAFVIFMRQHQPTIVVMEACNSAHYWGREINKMGHTARLIPAQHVTPFVRG